MDEKPKNKNKKKKILIVLTIIFVIVLACLVVGIYYYIDQNNNIESIQVNQNQAFLDFSDEVKFGQEISYEELLSKLIDTSKLQENTNIILEINDRQLSEEEKFKFENLGIYTVKIKLNYKYIYSIISCLTKTIESERTIEILIEDKEKPVINGVSDKQITVGDKINLSDGITAIDNVDGEVEVKIEGTVDNNKAGEYTIKVSATDKSGNTQEGSFKVTVKEKPVVTEKVTPKKSTGTSSNNSNSGSNTTTTPSSGNNIQDILNLTNQYRAEVGAAALTLDSKLSAAAQKRATELVSNQSHIRPDGSDCFSVLDDFGIYSFACGENIAWGQANGVLAAQSWRNSSGHYANMINKTFKKIGIGAYNQGGRWYWVQLFADKV